MLDCLDRASTAVSTKRLELRESMDIAELEADVERCRDIVREEEEREDGTDFEMLREY